MGGFNDPPQRPNDPGTMKLRNRLLVFSTAQLVIFGVAFAVAYGAFARSVLPMIERLLRDRTEQTARTLGEVLEVPLGADDRTLLAETVQRVVKDPDFAYLVVRDAHDRQVYVNGTPGAAALFAGRETTAQVDGGEVRAWAKISLEGLQLGSAAVAFSTARLDSLAAWGRGAAGAVALVWFAALAASFATARAFASPIRAMMRFSRKVAGGALSERLAIAAPGELAELRDYLNQMTAELERREAERAANAARTEAMRGELLTVSRMAGMAEIATGVLHNVGNVLNSLNVSVTMISDQVRGSRITGLTRSLEMVEAHPGGLPAFLSTDKGKMLPTYLSTVARRLAEDNARMLDELDSVNRNVEHIKSIVAMQQSYARPSGIKEPIAIAALIDDALRLGEASFAKHGIEVIKDYPGDIGLVSDRHKLLQILINLISNARHAIKEHRAPQAQLTVRARATSDTLTIAVIDTGVGIPAENLDKIFQHGFTTKPGGHGFGLHASANAARELGGRLRVASDGPGRGATFTLELPRTEGCDDGNN